MLRGCRYLIRVNESVITGKDIPLQREHNPFLASQRQEATVVPDFKQRGYYTILVAPGRLNYVFYYAPGKLNQSEVIKIEVIGMSRECLFSGHGIVRHVDGG